MASLIYETIPKFTAESLRMAAKQSEGCYTVPVRLRRAIKKYLRDQEAPNMRRNVLSLSQSLSEIKDVNLQLAANTSKELFEDPLKSLESSKRWKIKSSYGDIGFKYSDEQTIAYVASRMPAVFCACFRVLSEVRRRLPGFSPTSVLDFGAGTGSAFWALREVWPQSLERINLVEPSQSMQRAGQSLIKDQKNLPLIHSYDSLLALARKINKSERQHDLVIASYVLGEIPSLKDRFTIVRQLWNLTRDVLVLVEPGTPNGANIISQLRSHILWMEKRCHKLENASKVVSKDLSTEKMGTHIVAPCPHDGACPLDNTEKYCHFVQRLERTTSQRIYKRSKGMPLHGFEDEKFCFVVFRRGPRPREPWPLDGMKFDTAKEQRAKRNQEDIEIDDDDQFETEIEQFPDEDDRVTGLYAATDDEEEDDDDEEEDDDDDKEENEEEEERVNADVGSGWGRIVYSPVRRGRLVEMDVCKATNREGSEGCFERVVVTQSKNPSLHRQARKSLWGDLWPF